MPYAINGTVSQDELPGSVEISVEQYQQAINGMMDGMVVTVTHGFKVDWPAPPDEKPDEKTEEEIQFEKVASENLWVSAELSAVSRQLEAIEEAEAEEPPVDLLAGTKRQWLKYRGLVSNWKSGSPDFPDATKRPARPE